MKRSLVPWLAFCLLLAPSVSFGANTVCTDGRCITCDGPISCNNAVCTCNGVPVEGRRGDTRGPCGSEPTIVHGNGGGRVSTTASVAPSVFVSADSAVCGHAELSGPARLLAGSVVNGTARVSGRSTLRSSSINGAAQVTQSELTNSTLNGAAQVTESRLSNSTINGSGAVSNSEIVNSVLNGNGSVVGQQLHNSIINR